MTTIMLDDTYIFMTTAFFDSFSPPHLNGNGGAQPRKLASPPVHCTNCGKRLIEIEFSKGQELVCDNWHCHLFRQPQGCKTKEPEGTMRSSWHNKPSTYEAYKVQKRENYRLLREKGIEPKEANLMSSSSTRTQLTLDEAMNE